MNRFIRYTYPRNAGSLFGARGLESEINRLLDSALTDLTASAAYAPRFPVDLYEDKENTYVRAELPGVTREAINLEMADGYLTVSATRQEKDESVAFNRSIAIPESVQADKVTAAYENGVLTVILPK
jgi:HSP20 family protein